MTVMQGASWQRCKVHFYRNILAHVPQARKLELAAALRVVFGQYRWKRRNVRQASSAHSSEKH